MASNAKHKNLASSFGTPAPERGSKLQGMLKSPGRAAAPAVAPAAEPVPDVDVVAAPASELAPPPVPVQADRRGAATSAGIEEKPTQVHRKRAGEGRGSASSVYLSAETYKALTVTKSRKIKGYAQIVQDAFAQVAREAAEQKKSPEEVLEALFEVPEDHDGWLMPSSTARSKSATPLTEARISLSAQQRAWIEEKMAVVGRSVTFSEFVARVLDHHLLPAKRR
ncbi:hypothetical protein ACNUDN_06081 [Mycobacterium sp. smrl_JER01]